LSVAVPAGGGRDVEGRVAVEEADRLESEAGVVDGHDGPVLGTGEVGETEGVPQDDVGTVEVAVGGGPGRQAGTAGVLVDEVAGRIAFGRVVRGDPEVAGGEGGAGMDGRAGVGEQGALAFGVEGVAGATAEPVALSGLTTCQTRAWALSACRWAWVSVVRRVRDSRKALP
jgi:hypothetical protein